jgi:anthranilate synthase component II
MKTIIIDNYDSFTYNLFQYLAELSGKPVVVKNDEVTLATISKLKPTHIVISPGPGRPDRLKDFGVCEDVLTRYCGKLPILGVCLGHQGIATHFGGRIVYAPEVMHGKTSKIVRSRHKLGGSDILSGLGDTFEAMRYHSLVAEDASFPEELAVTASTEDNLIMALQHREWSLYGVQFHPESIGTQAGKKILKNFLSI